MPNVWSDAWEHEGGEEWTADRATRVARGGTLGATVYELRPGTAGGLYHFHHGAEELLVVLRGRPTLREPAGDRELEEGEVVVFPVGPDGAHQLRNDTGEPVRYLMVANRASPEAVEYPDSGELSVMAVTASQHGVPLWDLRPLRAPDQAD